MIRQKAVPAETPRPCSSSAGPTSPWPHWVIWRNEWWPWAGSPSEPTAGRPKWRAAWTPRHYSPLSKHESKVSPSEHCTAVSINITDGERLKHTLRLSAMRMRPWLVMRRSGVLLRSWSSLSMASASIRRLCQLISLNVKTWCGKKISIQKHINNNTFVKKNKTNGSCYKINSNISPLLSLGQWRGCSGGHCAAIWGSGCCPVAARAQKRRERPEPALW